MLVAFILTTTGQHYLEYSAPLGILGRLAEQSFLTQYLRRFLEARNREIKVVAESNSWRHFLPKQANPPLEPIVEKPGG